MRKIIVSSYITLDGVMQAPGGGEDNFRYSGWSSPYYDEAVDKLSEEQKRRPVDLLLGRKTFEVFASFFPDHEDIWPGVNDAIKYVVSNTMSQSGWKNSVFIGNISDIKKLKASEGRDLSVSGSGQLVQTLLKHDLVDELWLLIHPITLGEGRRLFSEGAIPAAFTLSQSSVSPGGVIMANYQRAGDVKTGTMG